ncbi:E3 ubiquitin-protein ligase MARCHF5 [Eublepharis macularius]|uniref:E3 ubiquitin-protein ligase MARCHF5 n=2 Tax=Bifurcata TaxID=1329961 RepID=A0AA97JMN4_EUBMA|nr:E3 ubiquitin-protein ligase MARCHF5 [Eublepharis macularius]
MSPTLAPPLSEAGAWFPLPPFLSPRGQAWFARPVASVLLSFVALNEATLSLLYLASSGPCLPGRFLAPVVAEPPGSPHPERMSEQTGLVMPQTMDRSCWVCFATDEDDRTAEWVRPCRCRGSTKWVHQTCLQRWVDEKQRGNSTARVACPQCNAEYLIVFPKLGPVVYVLDLADRLISKACPFAAAGIMVGSIYWTAVTYGAVTVMQVVGHKEGLDVMERADPLFLLIGLPTIPVMLILGKMIRWEDYVLRLWRKYSNKLQILNSIFPGIGCPVPRIPAEANPLADHVSATRILCGALVFPTIATIVGKLMFSSVNSNLQRTILGGIAFVAIKGAFKVYFKQQQYLRQAHRKILNYPEQEGA